MQYQNKSAAYAVTIMNLPDILKPASPRKSKPRTGKPSYMQSLGGCPISARNMRVCSACNPAIDIMTAMGECDIYCPTDIMRVTRTTIMVGNKMTKALSPQLFRTDEMDVRQGKNISAQNTDSVRSCSEKSIWPTLKKGNCRNHRSLQSGIACRSIATMSTSTCPYHRLCLLLTSIS